MSAIFDRNAFRVLPAAAVVAIVVLAGCATPPPPPGVLDNLRADLAALEENTELAELAPQALADARSAVRRAATDGLVEEERSQRVWLARKQLEIARAEGFAERARLEIDEADQRRTELLLRASRLEAQQARRAAENALLNSVATQEEMERAREMASRSELERDEATQQAQEARQEADQALRLAEAQSAEMELARREAELASQQAQSLQRRLEYMEYRQTDRGVVVTLGDVLFAVGETELLPSAEQSLNDVIELLESEPDKAIRIEGHTDSTGPASLNLRLSEARANAVRDALIELGIDATRLNAVGMGEDFPIATNQTEDGRDRNRRVDVIVLNE
ncbi:MAG TPA: OmpA family protein [Wenzhouxiangellaceae bacterium]|nr:OmpA family protein [Wenzhouxiangellaceae bacterium]